MMKFKGKRSLVIPALLLLLPVGSLLSISLSAQPTPTPSATPSPTPTATATATPTEAAASVFSAVLSGDQEAPVTTSLGKGFAIVKINPEATELEYSVGETSLQNIVSSHIHAGPPGQAGPILFTLSANGFSGLVTGTLNATDFTPAPGAGITTFAQALDAIRNGNTYVNVHTSANPNGEIRGQLSSGLNFGLATPSPTVSPSPSPTASPTPSPTPSPISGSGSGPG